MKCLPYLPPWRELTKHNFWELSHTLFYHAPDESAVVSKSSVIKKLKLKFNYQYLNSGPSNLGSCKVNRAKCCRPLVDLPQIFKDRSKKSIHSNVKKKFYEQDFPCINTTASTSLHPVDIQTHKIQSPPFFTRIKNPSVAVVVQTWRTILQDLNLFILQFFSPLSRKCWVGTSGLADLRALRTAPFGIGVAIKWQTHNLLGLLGPFCFHVLEWTECKDRSNDVEDVESV